MDKAKYNPERKLITGCKRLETEVNILAGSHLPGLDIHIFEWPSQSQDHYKIPLQNFKMGAHRYFLSKLTELELYSKKSAKLVGLVGVTAGKSGSTNY